MAFKSVVCCMISLVFSGFVYGVQLDSGVAGLYENPEEIFTLLEMDYKDEKMLDKTIRQEVDFLFKENTQVMHYLKDNLHFTTARTIRNTYNDNQFRADRLYNDNLLVVRGIVESITLGDEGQPVIEFRTGSTLSNTISYLREGHEDKAIDFDKGETIELFCRGGGLTGLYRHPTLYDCVLKESAVDFYYLEHKEAFDARQNDKYPFSLDVYAMVMILYEKDFVLSGGYESCASGFATESCRNFMEDERSSQLSNQEIIAKLGVILNYFFLMDREAFQQILENSESSVLRFRAEEMDDRDAVCEIVGRAIGFAYLSEEGLESDKYDIEELYNRNDNFKFVIDTLQENWCQAVERRLGAAPSIAGGAA